MNGSATGDSVEMEIRIEARFVLWALRCCAKRHHDGDEAAARELARGFELADASETLGACWRFAQALCGLIGAPEAWHHPECDCVSGIELQLLQTLSRCSTAQVGQKPGCSSTEADAAREWAHLVGDEHALLIDVLACQWLLALYRAGICYPPPDELVRDGCSRAYVGLPVPPQRH